MFSWPPRRVPALSHWPPRMAHHRAVHWARGEAPLRADRFGPAAGRIRGRDSAGYSRGCIGSAHSDHLPSRKGRGSLQPQAGSAPEMLRCAPRAIPRRGRIPMVRAAPLERDGSTRALSDCQQSVVKRGSAWLSRPEPRRPARGIRAKSPH